MEEADVLATRAAIISKRLLTVGTTQALRHKYSNLYHINLILRSAPLSSLEEMCAARDFVEHNVPGAKLERDMLGGQLRFTVPGTPSQASPTLKGKTSCYEELNVVRVINLLEENKERLGMECYSVAAATLENVFLSVVKANDVQEDDIAYQRGRKRAKARCGLF